MSYITRWFTGFTFAMISNGQLVNECPESVCHVFYVIQKTAIDCSNRSLTLVPQPAEICAGLLDHNRDITYLDISNNPDLKLTDTDMNNYPGLITLKMSWLITASHFSQLFFAPLSKIENLAMDGMHLEDDSGAMGTILPKNLLNIFLNYCHITKLDLSEMIHLSGLYIAYNNLNNIPKLSKDAPLTQLDLRMNPMNDLQYLDLAPFCLLTHLALQHTEFSELKSSAKFFECCQLEMWIRDHKIVGTVSLNCTGLHGNQECVYQNSPARTLALAERSACLTKNRLWDENEYSGFWFYFTNVCIGCTLIIVMTFLVFRFYRRRYKTPRRRKRRGTRYMGSQIITEETSTV